MRRYDEPVEVRKEDDQPAQFLWHGRVWKVREVVAHWVETGSWWRSPSARAVLGSDAPDDTDTRPDADTRPATSDLLAEREMWRVEAGRGSAPECPSGIFDLSFCWTEGRWHLIRCAD